jgi:hypothetical protein
MTAYTPDNWVILDIDDGKGYKAKKILAGWSGGYAHGSSWKISSGITKIEEDDTHYYIHNESGSLYICSKESYCLRMNNAYIWEKLKQIHGDKVKLMEENKNWKETINERIRFIKS